MKLLAAFLVGVTVGILGMLGWSLYVALHTGGSSARYRPPSDGWHS